MIVFDPTGNTYVHVDLPNYRVKNLIEEYENLEHYDEKDVTMDFSQFLIWSDKKDVTPEKVTEVHESEIREIVK